MQKPSQECSPSEFLLRVPPPPLAPSICGHFHCVSSPLLSLETAEPSVRVGCHWELIAFGRRSDTQVEMPLNALLMTLLSTPDPSPLSIRLLVIEMAGGTSQHSSAVETASVSLLTD